MTNDYTNRKKRDILQAIRDNPFISQKDLATRLNITRSAVAAHISALIREGEIAGRAYVLPERRRVVCVGGANVDRKIQTMESVQYGTSNPAVVTESHGGVARNIAENLARMGLPPSLVTMVGADKEGDLLMDRMAGLGADVSHVIRSSAHRTGTYTAILDVDGSMAVACADMEIYDGFTVDKLEPRRQVCGQAALAIVDTNLPAETLAYIVSQAAETGMPLMVAPVSSPKARRLPVDLRGVRTLVANRDELAAVSGLPVENTADLECACMALRHRGCGVVVITMGRDGVTWLDDEGAFGHLAADEVDVMDVTGAGDAFVAGFAYATVHGADVQQACQLAVRISGLALTTKDTVSTEIDARVARAWLKEILSTT